MPPSTSRDLALSLTIVFLKEQRSYVAYSPAFDLSASGSSLERAQKNFETTLRIFLDELTLAGTLNQVLRGLGWSKQERRWKPPVQDVRRVTVPFGVPVAA